MKEVARPVGDINVMGRNGPRVRKRTDQIRKHVVRLKNLFYELDGHAIQAIEDAESINDFFAGGRRHERVGGIVVAMGIGWKEIDRVDAGRCNHGVAFGMGI